MLDEILRLCYNVASLHTCYDGGLFGVSGMIAGVIDKDCFALFLSLENRLLSNPT